MRYREVGENLRRLFAFKEIVKRRLDWRYLLYRLKWHWAPRLDIVTKIPQNVDIELADACNLRCVMCVHGIEDMSGRTGLMDVEMARRLVAEAASMGVPSIKFTWRGEPALHKHLEDLIRYAKDLGVLEVQMNTNGIPFTDKRLERLVKSGLDRIIFSVDGASKETVEAIRVGADYDRLVRNIRKLHEIRQSLGQAKPFIRVQMVRTTLNAHEVDRFYELWKDVTDDIRVNDVFDRGQGEHMAVGDQVVTGRRRCPQPYQRLVIGRDGRASPCCSDWNQEFVVGDVHEQSLAEIWKGPRFETMRNVQRELRLDEVNPCYNCFVEESYTWERRSVTE